MVITGASSGIGAALARRLAGHGAVVGLIARRSGRLAEVLADCRRTSADSTMWVADLAQTATVGELGLRAWDDLGGIDVLVNNAAMPKRRAVDALDPAEVDDVMRVNFLAPMRLTLAVLPRMLERGHGVIVNVSSVGGRLGIVHEAAYCASKFALCGWSESMAVDLHGTGVRVKLISRGPSTPRSGISRAARNRSIRGPRCRPTKWPTASSRRWTATVSSTIYRT